MSLVIVAESPVPLQGETMVPMFLFNSMKRGEHFMSLLADVHPWSFDFVDMTALSGPILICNQPVIDAFDIIALCFQTPRYALMSSRILVTPHHSMAEVVFKHKIPQPSIIQPCSMDHAIETETLTSKHLLLEIQQDGSAPITVPIHTLALSNEGMEDLRGKIWVSHEYLRGLLSEEYDRTLQALQSMGQGTAKIITNFPDHRFSKQAVVISRYLFGNNNVSIYVHDKVELYNAAHCVEIPIELSFHA